MIADIEIDMPTHERLVAAQDLGELADTMPAMLAALVAAMTASMGRETTATVLRQWADEIDCLPQAGHA